MKVVGRPSRDDTVLGAVLATLVLIGVVDTTTHRPLISTAQLTLTLTCQLIVLAIGVLHVLPTLHPMCHRVWPLTLVVQATFALMPSAFGVSWGSAPGVLLGSCLILLPAWWGWTAVAVVEVLTLVRESVLSGFGLPCQLTAVTSALILWSVSSAVSTLRTLRANRAELARIAVARERSRFLRDLHDLLGYSFSAISLKGELALRLASTNPAAARAELRDIGALATEAARDLHAVAAGERELCLVEQLESAASLLEAAGIRTEVHKDSELVVPPTTNAVLATVVREAVTNLLKHSRATKCDIRLTHDSGSVTIEIVNDGVAIGEIGSRHGLVNLQSRLVSVGGDLSTEVVAGRFVLTARIPAARRAPASRAR